MICNTPFRAKSENMFNTTYMAVFEQISYKLARPQSLIRIMPTSKNLKLFIIVCRLDVALDIKGE